MDYEKKYKQLHTLISDLYPFMSEFCKEKIEGFFPELCESEDEKIRKEIINFLELPHPQFVGKRDHKKWLAWLEKQGECHISHDDEIMIKQLTEYFTTGHGLQNTNETVVEWLNDVKEKLEKRGEVESDNDDIEAEEKGIREAFNKIEDEKQGEQKPAVEMKTPEESLDIDSDTYNKIVDECIYGKQKSQRMISAEAKEAMYSKPSDKIEPKFKVGDWVVYYRNDSSREVLQVYDIRDGRYYFTDNVHFSWSVKECDEKSHLWTISDARTGDVLACGDKISCPFIFHNLTEKLNPRSYCGVNTLFHFQYKPDEDDGYWCYSNEARPATKEERDLLFSKMKNAGYEWDAEKKELKLYITNGGNFESENCKQKFSWSEEDDDDAWMNDIISKVENNLQLNKAEIDWLKSLRPQLKQKWSEEDTFKVQRICKYLDEAKKYYADITEVRECIDWLKSLKQRYTWKPSDEQIEILDMLLTNETMDDNVARVLRELIEQLKKLKGEDI